MGSNYSGSTVGGPDGNSQLSMASRHSSMLASSAEADGGAYRGNTSTAGHYGSQYSSMYGSSSLSSASQVIDESKKKPSLFLVLNRFLVKAVPLILFFNRSLQVPAVASKTGSSALEGRAGYASAVSQSPKFSSTEYVPTSSHGYGHKGAPLYGEKVSDYPGLDRRQYGERQGSYLGRDMQTEPAGRYADSVSYAHQQQVKICVCHFFLLSLFFLSLLDCCY